MEIINDKLRDVDGRTGPAHIHSVWEGGNQVKGGEAIFKDNGYYFPKLIKFHEVQYLLAPSHILVGKGEKEILKGVRKKKHIIQRNKT